MFQVVAKGAVDVGEILSSGAATAGATTAKAGSKAGLTAMKEISVVFGVLSVAVDFISIIHGWTTAHPCEAEIDRLINDIQSNKRELDNYKSLWVQPSRL